MATAVQSVARAIRILEALATAPAGVSDTARRVGLPKSTVARLLATLEDGAAVERGPDGQTFRLGPMIIGLASSSAGTANLAMFARPYLQRLTVLTGESAGLGIPDGYRVHYIAQTDSENPVQVRDWSDELIPMHVVPSGLVIMAQWPPEAVDRFLDRPLESTSPRSVVDPGQIRSRLELIKEQGHAWVFEEFVEGISSVAAAVVNQDNHVVAAVHVHGPAYRFPATGEEETIARLVMEAAARLSKALTIGT